MIPIRLSSLPDTLFDTDDARILRFVGLTAAARLCETGEPGR